MEIVQSTEHSIMTPFVRLGSENKVWARNTCPTCRGGKIPPSLEGPPSVPCPDCVGDPGFIQVALPREADKTGRVEIRIDNPAADVLKVAFTDDIAPFDGVFEISIEGAAVLAQTLMTMLKFRQMNVGETAGKSAAPVGEHHTNMPDATPMEPDSPPRGIDHH